MEPDNVDGDTNDTDYDSPVNERCHEFDECPAFLPFIEQGKPVFNAEYAVTTPSSSVHVLGTSICAP